MTARKFSLFKNLFLGMSYGNASMINDFDGSYVYVIEFLTWWVPTALPISQWKSLTAIFQWDLWLTIFLAFLTNAFIWWILGRKMEKSIFFKDFILCIMSSLYSLLQGSVKSPSNWNLRLVFIFWMMSCVLLFTAHQSSLVRIQGLFYRGVLRIISLQVSILTTPVYEHQISTLKEIVTELEFGFFDAGLPAFLDEDNWMHKIIRTKYYSCPLSIYCLNRTAFSRNFAHYRNKRNTQYFIAKLYTLPNDRKMIYEVDENTNSIWVRVHVLKGYPLLDRFDDVLMRLQSNGLMYKWDKDTRSKVKTVEGDEHKRLKVEHLQGAFMILGFGLSMSLGVFVLENLKKRLKVRGKLLQKYLVEKWTLEIKN